ncbi:hypothetical protein R3P38DRAFT_2577498, partial [Favolaschia claudopus]
RNRGKRNPFQVDWDRSTCGNRVNFNMTNASISKDAASPCSNVPVQFSLCDDHSPLVWTCNLEAHWRDRHKRTSGPYTYRNAQPNGAFIAYAISEQERTWLRTKWDNRFNKAKTSRPKTKRPPLLISEAHRSSAALRSVLSFIISTFV